MTTSNKLFRQHRLWAAAGSLTALLAVASAIFVITSSKAQGGPGDVPPATRGRRAGRDFP